MENFNEEKISGQSTKVGNLSKGPTKEDSCEYLQVVRAAQPAALTVVKETLPWDGGMLLFGKSIAFSSDSHFHFQSCTILSADRWLWKSICCMLYMYSFWGHWCINRIRWRHPQPWHEQRTKKQRISLNFCWQQIRPRVVARDGSDLFLFVQSPNQRHTRLYHTG